ncbi:MAG: sirohydrochlorin cobaltochelatase [Bacillota bacterium]|nr:sirohydrochlorin cobaltochelatase [Bacillota bacterium]
MDSGILVASFGTSYAETRKKCIEAIENLVARRYGAERVERAFTSSIVRRILKQRDQIEVCSPEEGLASLRARGYERIATLSLHILDGFEYSKLSKEYGPVARPLLDKDEDYRRIAEDPSFNDMKGCDALIFMGHGTEHEIAEKAYGRLQEEYLRQGKRDVYIGTVEGSTTIDDILKLIADKGYRRILLKPFMIVAGDHAQNDMASDEEDSWKSILTEHGYDVAVDLTGMGEYPLIQQMFLEKLSHIL